MLEAQGRQHAVERPLGVLLRLGQQRALLGRGLDLLLGQDVDLLLAVRVAGEEVTDAVEQACCWAYTYDWETLSTAGSSWAFGSAIVTAVRFVFILMAWLLSCEKSM